MRMASSFALSGLVFLAGAAVAQPQAPAPQAPRVAGYLGSANLPEAARILSAPPREGGERQLQDLAVFRATRALAGTPRWTMAQGDNDYAPAALMKHFGCALGASLDSQTAPRLAVLLRRMTIDAGAAANSAKQVFQRKRPYLFTEGDICIAKSQGLADSPDYPSGHSSLGWTAGLILSEISPERSTAIMARARAFGDSRVICGVHPPSAVEAGRATGSSVFAALHASPEFRADVEAARTEIQAARTAGRAPEPAACATESGLIAQVAF